MRTESEIRQRIRGLLVQELDRRVAEASKRLPHSCVHNRSQPLDTRKIVDGKPNKNFNRVSNGGSLPVIGLCMFGSEDPETWSGKICEDPIDAQQCPHFDPVHDKDTVLATLFNDLDTPGWMEECMPELAGLYWALGQDASSIQLPWWKKLWYWALQIRIEPLVPRRELSHSELTALLSPPDSPPPSLPP